MSQDVNSPGPKWVQAILRSDYFASVVQVVLVNSEVKTVAPFAQLEQLEFLELNHTQVSDLTPLAELKSLRLLNRHHDQ